MGQDRPALVSTVEADDVKAKTALPARPLSTYEKIAANISLFWVPWIWLTSAVLLTLLGAYGGEWFMLSDYVSNSGTGDQWAEYDGFNFFGLVLQCICLPLAGVSILGFALHSYKAEEWSNALKLATYAVILALFIFSAHLTEKKYTAGLLHCLGSICVNGADDDDGINSFKTSTAVYYVFACISMIIVFCTVSVLVVLDAARGRAARRRVPILSQPLVQDQELASEGSTVAEQQHMSNNKLTSFEERCTADSHLRQVVSFCLVAAILFPVIIFASMCVGDSWQHLTQSGLKSYASSHVPDNYGETWNFALSDKLVLTLFGDILIFWVAIYLVIVTCLLSLRYPRFRQLLCHRIKAPFNFGIWSYGELSMLTLYGLLMLSEGLYWYLDHGWEEEDPSDTNNYERLTRTLGQLANITMGLLILPVQRNSIFEVLLGVSWDGMVMYHRFLGYSFLFIVFFHMIFWWRVWVATGDFDHDWPISIPMYYNESNFTVPLAILTFWTMLVTHGILGMDYFRRRFFELFYYAHHFFLIVWVVILLHAASAWYYMLPALALFVVDRVLRLCSNLRTAQLVSLTPQSGAHVTRLAFTVAGGSKRWPLIGILRRRPAQEPLSHDAGQFVFLNIPAISVLQSHPFTISSSPGDSITTLHIKTMGAPDSFTQQLHDMAMEAQKGKSDLTSLVMNIEGPYGLGIDYGKYEKVVFIAGGIGVTPCHSIFRYMYYLAQEGAGGMGSGQNEGGCTNVHLVWAVKDSALFTSFRETLALVKEDSQGGKFTTDLYLTSGAANSSGFPVTNGRPNISELLEPLQPLANRALVFFCGPADMGRQASEAALEYKLSYHAETFEL